MPTGSLRSSIDRLAANRFDPGRGIREFHPSRVKQAHQEIERRFGDREPKPPEGLDLQRLHRRVVEAWTEGHLDQLRRRDLRALPWVLFYPPEDQEWLGADPDLIQWYEEWLSEPGRTRAISTLLRAFLIYCDKSCPTYGQILAVLRRLILGTQRPLLKRWQARSERLGLLEDDNHRRLRLHWWSSDRAAEQFLKEEGLSPSFDQSALLRRSIEDSLREFSDGLSKETVDAADLRRGLGWLRHGRKLRFDELRAPIAEALLGPFTARKPDAESGETLKEFFLDSFGDPRINRSAWVGIRQELRDVVFRLLVESTIEDFFRLLDKTALDRHWRYRKAFWGAYLKRGLISDAWIALGPRASDIADSVFERGMTGVGRVSGYGVLGNHSILMMKLEGVTIVEWSHNGSCRLWLPENRAAPKPYAMEYRRQHLDHAADETIAHHGSERGMWQTRAADWIWEQTGTRTHWVDYMPPP